MPAQYAWSDAARWCPFIFLAVVAVLGVPLSKRLPLRLRLQPTITTPKLNETQIAEDMIDETTSSSSNMMALVVPTGDYEKEAQLLKELESYDEVDYTMGLANIDATRRL